MEGGGESGRVMDDGVDGTNEGRRRKECWNDECRASVVADVARPLASFLLSLRILAEKGDAFSHTLTRWGKNNRGWL